MNICCANFIFSHKSCHFSISIYWKVPYIPAVWHAMFVIYQSSIFLDVLVSFSIVFCLCAKVTVLIKSFFNLIFIVIQLQLCAFSPHPSTPPHSNPPPSPTSTLPLDFVHVSFIVVPVIHSPHCPLPTPPCPLLDCS